MSVQASAFVYARENDNRKDTSLLRSLSIFRKLYIRNVLLNWHKAPGAAFYFLRDLQMAQLDWPFQWVRPRARPRMKHQKGASIG